MYRHLIVFVQQQLPETKLQLGRCWDAIARWEISEPVEHRVPLPFAGVLSNAGCSAKLGLEVFRLHSGDLLSWNFSARRAA